MSDLNAVYGHEEVCMARLCDAAGVIRVKYRAKLEKCLDQFEASFPQLFISVYLGALDERANIRQFGMWLLNHAAFEDVDITRSNEGGVLFVVDVNSKVATISFGYLLDPFLTETDTFLILSKAHPYLLAGDYVKALHLVIKKLTKILKKRAVQANRHPEQFEQKSQAAGQILQRIRAGHRRMQERSQTRVPEYSEDDERW